jgi:phosphoribosyl-ATP pyrophosphohydrolase
MADAADILARLQAVIEARKGGDPETSYVAKRLSQGTAKIAQKVGEEAVETAIAAVSSGREAVVAESADLLFHLMILWADAGIAPDDVLQELARREGISGIDEKKSRGT